ncbi:hypothetical protein ASF69_09340 [Rhizobium sp. Leaf311]|nr:hypothetical protein ASF69_09340 [Rhizobium sp. Leaf311]
MGTDLIDELQAVIDSFWARTKLSDSVSVERSSRDFGYPHVEVVKGKFDIVITERGQEVQRLPRLSMMEAARWYLVQMAREQASKLELSLRTKPEDARLYRTDWLMTGTRGGIGWLPQLRSCIVYRPSSENDFKNTLLRSPLEHYEKRTQDIRYGRRAIQRQR